MIYSTFVWTILLDDQKVWTRRVNEVEFSYFLFALWKDLTQLKLQQVNLTVTSQSYHWANHSCWCIVFVICISQSCDLCCVGSMVPGQTVFQTRGQCSLVKYIKYRNQSILIIIRIYLWTENDKQSTNRKNILEIWGRCVTPPHCANTMHKQYINIHSTFFIL